MLWFTQIDWSLFISALISSTLLPGGSEALLIYKLQNEASTHEALIISATLGNVFGSIITYYMGKYGFQFSHKWLHITENKLTTAKHQFQRFGTPALLFAWLPIIGDPLCFIAGSLKYHFLWFVVLVGLGKALRYILISLPLI